MSLDAKWLWAIYRSRRPPCTTGGKDFFCTGLHHSWRLPREISNRGCEIVLQVSEVHLWRRLRRLWLCRSSYPRGVCRVERQGPRKVRFGVLARRIAAGV